MTNPNMAVNRRAGSLKAAKKICLLILLFLSVANLAVMMVSSNRSVKCVRSYLKNVFGPNFSKHSIVADENLSQKEGRVQDRGALS